MGTTKKIGSSKRRELYYEILLIGVKHFDKEAPTDLIEAISRGPSIKNPILVCSFLLAVSELTGNSIALIVRNYNIEKEEAAKIGAKWMVYYKDSRFIQKDVALICMLVREKYCNPAPHE